MRKKVQLMGIINLTPDSFHAPSRVHGAEAVLERAGKMLREGADILDFGAASTRPGAAEVGAEEEWKRLETALTAVREAFPEARISVDSYHSEVVLRCYDKIGPFLVNDISGGQADPAMLDTVGRLSLPYVAMHTRGTPRTMQSLTDYPDGVVAELIRYFEAFAEKAERAHIEDWILDPGFGFAKTREQNWELLRRIGELRRFGRPLLVGISRKSMLGSSPENALQATLNAERLALEQGADILRVHDVAETKRLIQQGPDCPRDGRWESSAAERD